MSQSVRASSHRWRDIRHGIFDAFRDLAQNSPSRFAIMVYVGLILIFTGLFSLPIAASDGQVTPLADALFTAVSTICVTGLATVDMATHWSPFGHVVVFVGVQIGAMGVLTLASILGLVISRRLGLRAKLMAASDTNPLRSHAGPVNEGQTVQLGQIGSLLRVVALSTLVIEAVVAILLYPGMLLSGIEWNVALWEAPFYAAMSFTNTGFTPNPEGLSVFADNYWVLLVLMGSVFLGSIGFPVIFALRKELWHLRRWPLHTKLTLITTTTLFFIGGLIFIALEFNNPLTLGRLDAADTTMQAFFLSAMTRSGGFAILDMTELNGSSQVVVMMLMFVGGGSASTAGGIKVTTLAVIALAVWSEAKGRTSNQVFGRRIPSDVLRVALSVLAWGSTIVAVSTVIILQITKADVVNVLFDVISGFATVGLSTGLTEDLPAAGKYVLAVTILMGRVGTVTLAAAVAATSRSQLYSLPVERPIVG